MRKRTPYGLIALSLGLGAGYDAVFGAALLITPSGLAQIFGLVPPEGVYLRLIGVLLILVAGFYGLAIHLPGTTRTAAALAAIGRFGGALVLLLEYAASARWAFLLLGLADLGFALLHLLTLILQRPPADREAEE